MGLSRGSGADWTRSRSFAAVADRDQVLVGSGGCADAVHAGLDGGVRDMPAP
ncbi:hypothetical protein [Streptomyces sp. NPDC047071]|uniref:hypothetical protein n=1 Tax=Streptomyces sp. NPDC047071 TaxID=3154808 RepID=UPI003455E0EB